MNIQYLLQLALVIPVMFSPSTARAQSVPIRVGMDYGLARQRLIQAGWRPLVRSRPAAPNDSGTPYSLMDQQIALTSYFRKRGWHETLGCAPTGLGLCGQQFFNANGKGLVVTTTNGYVNKPPVVKSYRFGNDSR
jgi:hypothetical protein